MGGKDQLPVMSDATAIVGAVVARARVAQAAFDAATQEEVDEVVTAVGWAIVDPEHNRALAEASVRDTGLGNVADKIAKNRRKTMGLLRDLAGARSVGVISKEPESGLVEIARAVGVVGANPASNGCRVGIRACACGVERRGDVARDLGFQRGPLGVPRRS